MTKKAVIKMWLKRLLLHLVNTVNSNHLSDSHDQADYKKGDMMPTMGRRGELDHEKIVCKFAPVSQKIESDKNQIL